MDPISILIAVTVAANIVQAVWILQLKKQVCALTTRVNKIEEIVSNRTSVKYIRAKSQRTSRTDVSKLDAVINNLAAEKSDQGQRSAV